METDGGENSTVTDVMHDTKSAAWRMEGHDPSDSGNSCGKKASFLFSVKRCVRLEIGVLSERPR